MSERNQTSTPKVRPQRRRVTRRPSRLRLPTPPPDPSTLGDSLEQPTTPTPSNPNKDVQFFDYENLLQQPNANTNPLFAPVIATNNAFDHLDKLYKLMDQMLNLRQQNARLQKRIRDLEHIKNLQALHHELCKASTFEEIPEIEDDTVFAESLLDTMLTGNKKEVKPKPWTRSRLRQSIMKRPRHRSSSLNEKGQNLDVDDPEAQRRSSALGEREKPAKVSKWTKVKAAFRWEKASASVSGAKSQDSGLGVMVPMNYEVARYLRVPSTAEDHVGISPGDSGAAEGSSPGSLSSASSVDEIHRQENPRTTDDDVYYAKNAKRNPKQIPYVKMRKKIQKQEKFRISNCSDDYKLEMSEEELRDDRSKMSTSGEHSKGDEEKLEKHEISSQIVERYKQVVAEDEKISKQKASSKRSSKWIRVKKAFLTPSNLKPNPQTRSRSLGVCQEVQVNKNEEENKKVQDEIQRNYRQLQKRLSLEFKGKIQEWNKSRPVNISDASGTNVRSDSSSGDPKSQEFMKKMEEWQRIKSQPNKPRKSIQMIKEQNLAPEFKRKLEEWQKIKNQPAKDDSVPVTKPKKKLGEWPKWKSVSSHKHEPNEHQPLSDDFLRKLEEWRKLKEIKEKTPSPRLPKKQISEPSTSKQSQKVKEQDDLRELQWFEKELGNIEREKQRLEIERQKFLQREERLAKLRRTIVNNGNKKDILIHTPTGLYKFEGISREFTQKLCEWEKVQGIKPEESTFALLSSSFTPHITVDSYESDNCMKSNGSGLKLLRSKSAESVAVFSLVDPGSPTTHHPSSLSLNDVDELERQCFVSSPNSSAQDIYNSVDNVQQDEPEAVIVEFEDVVEETAGPLEMLEEKHFPIYQREKSLNICEENCFVNPYVQVAQYKSSQYSYFLIDEIMATLRSIAKDEEMQWDIKNESRPNEDNDVCDSDYDNLQSPDLVEIERKTAVQKQRANKIIDNVISLQEAHSKNISDVAEDSIMSGTHFHNLLESAQDLFSDLFQLAEQLQNIFQSRSSLGAYKPSFSFSDFSYSDVIETTSELSSKISEYKRIVTYYFAASEMTTTHQTPADHNIREKQHETDSSGEETKCESNYSLLKSKRIKFKRKDYCGQTLDESSYVEEESQNDNFTQMCPIVLENLIIPTKPNYVSASQEIYPSETQFPELFVKTTKKVFAPIIQIEPEPANIKVSQMEGPKIEISEPSVGLPPLLASPKSLRKMSKEISPSIKLMLAKYNQLISEQEYSTLAKSAASSGSASPVAWRSPVSERRVKAQRERYLEVVRKNFGSSEVKKSASVSILNTEKKLTQLAPVESVSENQPKQSKGILRSTSASIIPITKDSALHLKLILPEKFALNPRAIKIEQAKKEFLNASDLPIAGPSSAPILPQSYSSCTNRSSLISVGSESSCGSSNYGGLLVKSASAGMINVDEDTYKKIDPAFHQEGYVTLPRSVQKEKEGFLAGKLLLSNIASKFRKVRMRKHKESKKMSTVSTLCRQSLVVDINLENQEKENRSDSLTVPVYNRASSSEDTSPSSSRSGSWIRRSRIFKAL